VGSHGIPYGSWTFLVVLGYLERGKTHYHSVWMKTRGEMQSTIQGLLLPPLGLTVAAHWEHPDNSEVTWVESFEHGKRSLLQNSERLRTPLFPTLSLFRKVKTHLLPAFSGLQ
jgi:hypothetical protein